MKAINLFLAAALIVLVVSPLHAEDCRAGSTSSDGEQRITPIRVDLASTTPLNRAAVPEGTSGVACGRLSIVPMPDDVRVLIEWRVSFGVVEGSRSLWIWARAGQLQTTVDGGELSSAESSAVGDWLLAAQARFNAALARR